MSATALPIVTAEDFRRVVETMVPCRVVFVAPNESPDRSALAPAPQAQDGNLPSNVIRSADCGSGTGISGGALGSA